MVYLSGAGLPRLSWKNAIKWMDEVVVVVVNSLLSISTCISHSYNITRFSRGSDVILAASTTFIALHLPLQFSWVNHLSIKPILYQTTQHTFMQQQN